jgi:hypothetical protein
VSELGINSRSKRPDGNQQMRHRRQCLRAYKLSTDGWTVRNIAALLQITEHKASQMIKVGERFSQ